MTRSRQCKRRLCESAEHGFRVLSEIPLTYVTGHGGRGMFPCVFTRNANMCVFFLYLISRRTCVVYFTYLRGEFDEQMNFRLQRLLIDGRVVRPTPYGRVVVFRLRHEPQHRPRGKPPAIRRHGLDVRLDAVHDRRTRSIGPSNLW